MLKTKKLEAKEILKEIIHNLRDKVNNKNLDKKSLEKIKEDLEKINYKYDENKYPPINLDKFKNIEFQINDSPVNLAEAFLWKLGKWKEYKQFVSRYHENDIQTPDNAVIYYAFAKFLKEPNENPIFDQHAFRAIVAICFEKLSDMHTTEWYIGKDDYEWSSGIEKKVAKDSYNFFVKKVKEIVNNNSQKDFSLKEFDSVLMPLGKAIKKNYKNFKEFYEYLK